MIPLLVTHLLTPSGPARARPNYGHPSRFLSEMGGDVPPPSGGRWITSTVTCGEIETYPRALPGRMGSRDGLYASKSKWGLLLRRR